MNYHDFFELAKSKGIERIQITEETKQENSIYFINEKIEDYTDSEKISYAIKAEKNGKTETAYSEYLDESIIDMILEKFIITESHYENEYLKKEKNNKIEEKPIVSIKEEKNKIIEINNLKEKYPCTKTLEIQYGDIYTKTRIINNNDVDIATSLHNYEVYIEGSAEQEGKISTYSESMIVSDKNKIDFEKTTDNVLKLATLGINKEKLENRKYNIILSNKVASKILMEFQKMLSAEAIHQKKSCLHDKLNKKIFSEKITILEQPTNNEFPGYTIFDKEGTSTIDKVIVENGILKTYLYDIKEAKVDKIKSTGNKYNGIATRNMFIKPKDNTVEELLNEIKDGLYITHYMGSIGSSIKCSSGNITMQIFGYVIENGKLKGGFSPAVLTSTIFELLTNIENIGEDLNFSSLTAASPSLYIKNISIAGE